MPVYNPGNLLKDSISDIIHQTFTDWELIVIDDGSSDQSDQILQFFSDKDSRIKLITQENKGAGTARNIGMENASGKYLIFLDADDRFERTLLEELFNKAESTEAQIVVCNAKQFDMETHTFLSPDKTGYILNETMLPDAEIFSYREIKNNLFIFSSSVVWNKLFKADFLKDNNILFQNTPFLNDSFFAICALALADKITCVKKELIYYRLNNLSSVSSFSKKSKNPEILLNLFFDLNNKLKQEKHYDLLRPALAKFAVISLCGHERIWNENNYSVLQSYLSNGLANEININLLTESDFSDPEMYHDVDILCKKGLTSFFARIMHRNFNIIYQQNNITQQSSVNDKIPQIFSDYFYLNNGTSVVIYGAGYRGHMIYRQINNSGRIKVLGIVDKNFLSVKSIDNFSVLDPQKICTFTYDYVIIAIDDVNMMREILNNLKILGVEDKKIIW